MCVNFTIMKSAVIVGILLFIAVVPNVYAQENTLKITTDKETYYFGDFLSFTIITDVVTGDFAVIHIVDDSGKKSSPINLPIIEKTTTITAPNPFGSEIFNEGKYIIEVDYNGKRDSQIFLVKDSGSIIIPIWIKDLGKWWIEEKITDREFVKGIEYLIENQVIVISQESVKQNAESSIPNWVRESTKWWTEDKVSDDEYANALEYLIKIGIIVINSGEQSEQT